MQYYRLYTNLLKNYNKKDLLALAPMEDVTDIALRHTLIDFGLMSHMFFTEFTNVEGILTGKIQVLHRLVTSDIVLGFPTFAQLWGSNKQKFYDAVLLVLFLGYWGIDLNMGCPVKKVVKKGLGAGLIVNKNLALDLVNVAKQATNDFWNNRSLRNHWFSLTNKRIKLAVNYLKKVKYNYLTLGSDLSYVKSIISNIEDKINYLEKLKKNLANYKPTLSIKTRISNTPKETDILQDVHSDYLTNYRDIWLEQIFTWPVDFITIHLRTAEEMSKVPAHFELIEYINALAIKNNKYWLINGDIFNIKQAFAMVKDLEYNKNILGFMVGRGLFKNPFIFTGYEPVNDFDCNIKNIKNNKSVLNECIISKKFLASIYKRHIELFNNFFNVNYQFEFWQNIIQKFNKITNNNIKLTYHKKNNRKKFKYKTIKNMQMLEKFKKMYKIKYSKVRSISAL